MRQNLSKSEVASLFNVSEPTISRWVAEEYMPFLVRGNRTVSWVFDKEQVLEWYNMRKWRKGKRSDLESFQEARARKTAAEATLAELALEKERQKLVEIEHVAKTVEKEYMAIRNKFLVLPAKLAPQLYILDDLIKTQQLLEREINEVLEDLSYGKGS